MSKPGLVRLGGLAAAVGGVSYAVVQASYFFLDSARPAGGVMPGPLRFPFRFLLNSTEVALALLFLIGLVGLYVTLGARSWLGISGLVLASVSVLASLSSLVFFAFNRLLFGAHVLPRFGADLLEGLLLAGGILLLGVAAVRTRAPGTLKVLPLLLGLLSIPFLLLVISAGLEEWAPLTLLFVLRMLRGVGWALLGATLWSLASREESGTAQDNPA